MEPRPGLGFLPLSSVLTSARVWVTVSQSVHLKYHDVIACHCKPIDHIYSISSCLHGEPVNKHVFTRCVWMEISRVAKRKKKKKSSDFAIISLALQCPALLTENKKTPQSTNFFLRNTSDISLCLKFSNQCAVSWPSFYTSSGSGRLFNAYPGWSMEINDTVIYFWMFLKLITVLLILYTCSEWWILSNICFDH